MELKYLVKNYLLSFCKKSKISKIVAVFLILIIFSVARQFLRIKTFDNTLLKKNESNIDTNRSNSKNDLNEYCKKFGEWELIDNRYYFKRSATYYFIDAEILRFSLIKSSYAIVTKYIFYVSIKFNEQEFIQLQNVVSTRIDTRFKLREFELVYIDAKFNLTKYFNTSLKYNFDHDGLTRNILIEIQVEIEQIGKIPVKSESNLTAKIKYLKKPFSQKSKNALVCSKCLYTHKDDFNSKKLEWWIEVNRQAGYENIAFCNQSIADHSNYRNLFKRNKDFLIISQLKCVPNLGKTRDLKDSNYLEIFGMLRGPKMVELIDTLMLSECYFNNFNEYKYVAILDEKEVIIPKLLDSINDKNSVDYIKSLDIIFESNYNQTLEWSQPILSQNKCNRYPINNLAIENFLNDLNSKSKLHASKSFYFFPAFYLKNDLVKLIFKELDHALKNFETNATNKKTNQISFITEQIKINVDYEENMFPKKNQSNFESRELKFTISNLNEYEYSKNLLALYSKEIEPYLSSKKQFLKHFVKDFDRFFYIPGGSKDMLSGKSIHNSTHVFDFTIHSADKFIPSNKFNSMDIVNSDYSMLEYDGNYKLPSKSAHMSIFDSFFNSQFSTLAFTNLHFDSNYFICYFVPIFEKFLDEIKHNITTK
jgi:hypothetical protein